MIDALIIDDEMNALDVLSSLISNYCPDVRIIKKCQSGEEAISAIKELSPDLIFLDIEMPIMNGFDVLNQTIGKNYKVIFTTAYDQFAIKAFKYSTVDYLLKPIDIEELKLAVQKIITSVNYDLQSKMSILFEQLSSEKSKTNKLALPVGEGYEIVPFENIVRAESESNYTFIFLKDKRKITLTKTLKEVEEILIGSTFFRVHNSHLININFISKFYKGDGGYIVLLDGTQINISRTKRDEFYKFVGRL